MVDVESEETEEDQNIYNTEVKVGHYSDYNVYPTCGLATSKAIVGEVDDPRYFLIRIESMLEFCGLQKVILSI